MFRHQKRGHFTGTVILNLCDLSQHQIKKTSYSTLELYVYTAPPEIKAKSTVSLPFCNLVLCLGSLGDFEVTQRVVFYDLTLVKVVVYGMSCIEVAVIYALILMTANLDK